MKKRLAVLMLGATLASIMAITSPARAACVVPSSETLPKSAVGAFVFANGVAVGGAGGESQGWCVGGPSHEWNTEGVGTASCTDNSSVAISGGITFTSSGSNGVIDGASSPNGNSLAAGVFQCVGGAPSGAATLVDGL